ncbi:MAG: quinone oxidoreductase family protein [Xanthobacteraceae bacterium]
MKANVIHAFGPPDVLKYEEVPDPMPRPGEVRIRVHAATVNRVLDVSLRAGKEMFRGPALPLIPGVDCAGVVDALGPGVTKRKVGERVAAAGTMPLDVCPEDCNGYTGPQGMMGIKRQGGFAELVCVPACATVDVPAGLDFRNAAVVMRHIPTAWNLLFNVAQLKKDETVLVMGAGGNLGTVGIQIAKNVIGAKVIAAAGSDERCKTGRELGADHAVNYNTHNIYDELMKFTGGKGVNVLYDNIANPKVLPLAFRAIGMNGRLVTAGAHGGPNVSIDFSHLYHKQITVRGRPGHEPSDIPKCFAAAAEGKVRPLIEKILPMSQAAEAHRLVESGEIAGKIVLDTTMR